MKKIISLLTVAMLIVCALTGCGGNKEAVATDGSTSMNEVIGALGEAFEAETGISVTYNATGSGAGIQAVQEGRCDIGLASRNLKDEEKVSGLEGTVLAYDGIAIIVNPENPVSNPDVIGYASLASVKDTVKALTVDGVKASEVTIKDGSYVVQRPFVLVTKKDAKLSESAQEFFDFVTSEAANEIIISAGVVPAN